MTISHRSCVGKLWLLLIEFRNIELPPSEGELIQCHQWLKTDSADCTILQSKNCQSSPLWNLEYRKILFSISIHLLPSTFASLSFLLLFFFLLCSHYMFCLPYLLMSNFPVSLPVNGSFYVSSSSIDICLSNIYKSIFCIYVSIHLDLFIISSLYICPVVYKMCLEFYIINSGLYSVDSIFYYL